MNKEWTLTYNFNRNKNALHNIYFISSEAIMKTTSICGIIVETMWPCKRHAFPDFVILSSWETEQYPKEKSDCTHDCSADRTPVDYLNETHSKVETLLHPPNLTPVDPATPTAQESLGAEVELVSSNSLHNLDEIQCKYLFDGPINSINFNSPD